jgi:hypothetical protein
MKDILFLAYYFFFVCLTPLFVSGVFLCALYYVGRLRRAPRAPGAHTDDHLSLVLHVSEPAVTVPLVTLLLVSIYGWPTLFWLDEGSNPLVWILPLIPACWMLCITPARKLIQREGKRTVYRILFLRGGSRLLCVILIFLLLHVSYPLWTVLPLFTGVALYVQSVLFVRRQIAEW